MPDGSGTNYNQGEVPEHLLGCYLYAQWEAAGEPFVVFCSVGGSFVEGILADGNVYSVPAENTVTAPAATRTDFDVNLIGWGPNPLGSMVYHEDNVWNMEVYLPGDTVVTDQVLTLYASWMDVSDPEKAIIYHSNGNDVAGSSVIVNYTETTSCCTNLPSRTGYTLTGWNTAPDGSGITFGLGETIDVTTAVIADQTIVNRYAQWKRTITW